MEPWIWLFPAIYLLHILEESFAGERFYNWTHRIVGRRIPFRAFLALNACFLALMIAAVLALQGGNWLWLLSALGTITAVNGLGHFVGTLATRSYSPGVITGLLLWLPLGVAGLTLSRSALTAEAWWLGIAAGASVSGLVIMSALAVSRSAPS
jgi:hypothetical protein